ncbi:MAG: hypothetical protein AAB607_01170, partial [Patescibacteria group bacterium]
ILTVVVLLVALAAVFYWQKVGFEEPYYAVYLNTGDLYFGKLDYFPKLSLNDVYFLQQNSEDQQNPLSITKFENAFWGPKGKIYLNDEAIVWKVKLKKDSQLLQVIKAGQPVQPQSQFQQSTSTSK